MENRTQTIKVWVGKIEQRELGVAGEKGAKNGEMVKDKTERFGICRPDCRSLMMQLNHKTFMFIGNLWL